MWENQNGDPAENDAVEVVTPKATYEELEGRIVEITANLERFKNSNETYANKVAKYVARVDGLEEYLKENWEDLGDHAEAIAEIFGISVTSTKTFTFEVSVTVEVEAKSPAFDWSSFDGSEIDLDISASVAYNHRAEISDASVEDSEITSCDEA